MEAATLACGAPAYNPATDRGTFLWQNCQTGAWHLRVTAGISSSEVKYSGSIVSSRPLTAAVGVMLEGNDLVTTSVPGRVGYTLGVSRNWEDGVDFSLASGATGCLTAGGAVIAGPNRTTLQTPVDITTLGACGNTPPPVSNGYAYLNDADTSDSIERNADSDLGDRPFPRIATGPIRVSGSAEQFSKYDVIALKSHRFDWLASIQAVNPDTRGLRIHSPFGYQGYTEKDPCGPGSGMPFGGTGAATSGCNVFAGHWLYAAGTTLSRAIAANTTNVQVIDATLFNPGRYVVIYDGRAGSFENAEHAKVTAVNTDTNTLTLSSRGLKSTARAHPVGAIVAEHVIGNGDALEAEIWTYNHSTTCPRDSSGRQLNVIMAEWLANNYNKDKDGGVTKAKIHGIMFDADFHFIQDSFHNKKPDVNNDLVQDNGFSPTGENFWGEGLDDFYTNLRERLPNALIVGGVIETRGYTSLNGSDFEGWPQRDIGTALPDYREIDGRLSIYSAQMHHGNVGPRYVEIINRVSTRIYQFYNTPGTSNAPFRFSFGLTLLDDGYYGQENNTTTRDPWWDEYAVDIVPGSPTYGRAIASTPNNEALIRRHRGWMGFPQGPRYRIYDDATFAPARNLMPDGTFDSGLGNWRGSNVSVRVDTTAANRLEGAGALAIGTHQNYAETYYDATATGPTVQLTAGVEYTLAFAVKAEKIRSIQVVMGTASQQYHIPAKWSRQVMTFTASRTGNFQLKFNVGKESSNVWIDSVYLFEGNASVFRRDFDNAIVVVNATPTTRTVDLGGTFQRIRGTGQDAVNDGSAVTRVTLPSYDAAVLIRR
ncbi:putative glycoside hydrolase [uncultured Lamprocystis sp.]|uniref:putative glycoside hydrolase n=1 Tax=uncultured Lamprocystis sp. TaxID=543132 RepID=UPI0025D60980|nr:putative glycoside hydrolase [uncultured Lamprocystis sp.]